VAVLIRYLGQVQSGGSFDVDYQVIGPGDKMIMDGTKERQGDFVFVAQSIGEYRFCFNNEMSTFAEKTVDFEIAVRLVPPPPENFFFPEPCPPWGHFALNDSTCDYCFYLIDANVGGGDRSKTNPAPNSPQSRERAQNKHLLSKKPSTKFLAN
jgi:hypothetical protein